MDINYNKMKNKEIIKEDKALKKLNGILIAVICIISILAFAYYKYLYVDINVNSGTLKELTDKEKIEDFEYLYNVIKNNYPYLEVVKRKTGYDWLNNKEEFKNMVLSSKDNIEFYHSIEKILYLLQNAHTGVIKPVLYPMYKDAYKKLNYYAWKKILTNENINKKYSYWEKIIKDEKNIVPIKFAYVEGKYIAYKNIDDEDNFKIYDIPKFSALIEVNGILIDKYVLSKMDSMYLNYDFKRKKLKANDLIIYCNENEYVNLKFITLDGKIIERNLKGENIKFKKYNDLPDKLYNTQIIEKDKIAYIKISSFSYEYVDKDKEGIYSFFKSIKDYPYLIIDIRGNGGGSESYYIENIVSPLIDKEMSAEFYLLFRGGKEIRPFLTSKKILKKSINKLPKGLNYPEEIKDMFAGFIKSERKIHPQNSVGFKGKIYLLVDDRVYSSAETFSAFSKASGFATLIGTETGGDGIGIDPAFLVLPNSGLLIRFSIDMGLNPDGTSNEEYHTQPDIYVEIKEKDFKNYIEYNERNKDNILNPYDTVLNYTLSICD